MNLYDISRKVTALEEGGRKILKFNVGDPDQATDPRIIEALMNSLKRGETKYGPAMGILSLREKLAEIHGTQPENVFVSTGSKIAIFYAMKTLLREGDNVIIPSPHWSAYELIAKSVGAEPRFIRTEPPQWQIDPKKIAAALDKKTKLIVLCNPSNPTSKIIEPRVLDSIARIGRENGITILSDECYADIAFKPVSTILDYDVGSVCVRSLSKTFAMTGWRVGYTITSTEKTKEFGKLAEITTTSIPVFIQRAAERALDFKGEIATEMALIYRKRADKAIELLGGTNLVVSEPDAPFYLFPDCMMDSEALASRLIDKGVAIAPGTAFGAYKNHFRLALTLPDNEIERGLRIIANGAGGVS